MARITVEQHLGEQFYKMHKWLFEGKYKDLTNDSRVAYMLLNDRHNLSVMNNWINEKNEIYFIYTRNELAEIIGVGKNKMVAIFKQLVDAKLIEDERQGLGKPNRLYLLKPEVSKSNFKKFENQTSRSLQHKPQEVCKPNPNKNEFSKNEFINNDIVVSSLNEVPTLEEVKEETNEQKIIQDLQALNIPTTSHTVEVVEDWLSMHEVELIKAVIDKCVSTAKNGVNLNYLKRAMQSLTAKGIKTVEDLERAESLRSKGTNKQRTETMPDYSNQSTETENMTEAEKQATLQEIEELMKELI